MLWVPRQRRFARFLEGSAPAYPIDRDIGKLLPAA